MNEKMEIIFSEFICLNCGTTIESMKSVNLDIPHMLDVECPECHKKEIVFLTAKRMVQTESEEEYD